MAFLDGPACGIGSREDGFHRQFFQPQVHALGNCLVDSLPGLGHRSHALDKLLVQGFGLGLVKAGSLEMGDLLPHAGQLVGQDFEGIFAFAHASPAPALCALASRSARSPASSF